MSYSFEPALPVDSKTSSPDVRNRRRISPESVNQFNQKPQVPRSAWASRPGGRAMDRAATRSLSPVPADRQTEIPRSRTPNPPPVSRYNYVPREYTRSPPKLTLNIPPSHRPTPQPRQLPPTRNAQDSPRGRSDSSEEVTFGAGPASQQNSSLLPRHRPGGQLNALAPLHSRLQAARRPRKHVPSMVDYPSLEQLESMWENQDRYVGTVFIAPQKPASPIWRIIQEPPRSSDLPVHPAFRDDPENDPNYHNVTFI